ncbi:hypothetical protein ACKVMT_14555 [Halobacteriales archaeon Cl-PHB]
MLKTGAGRLATAGWLPTSLRAVMGYYADTGVFDYRSLQLKRRVDDVTEAMVDEAFAPVETAVAAEFDRETVEFIYDTKLVLPAQLTLGYLYRRLPETEHDRAEALTRLAIEALIDGDMRDAINDDEFEDFEVDFSTDESDRREIAVVAQEVLQERVEAGFADYPDAVREAYDWAVDVSEAHQDDDPHFRDLMAAAEDGDEAALAAIEAEYRDADFADPPAAFDADDRGLPYFKTQYDRVGVIYDGMIRMYEAADFPIDEAFTRAIVLAIVGAQVWLDDVDDFAADRADGQLTPVTAEFLLADTDREAHRRVVDVTERYLDRAKAEATAAESPLTGIAVEYIYRDGDPDVLPGATR